MLLDLDGVILALSVARRNVLIGANRANVIMVGGFRHIKVGVVWFIAHAARHTRHRTGDHILKIDLAAAASRRLWKKSCYPLAR